MNLNAEEMLEKKQYLAKGSYLERYPQKLDIRRDQEEIAMRAKSQSQASKRKTKNIKGNFY